jgi:hypothetical protein
MAAPPPWLLIYPISPTPRARPPPRAAPGAHTQQLCPLRKNTRDVRRAPALSPLSPANNAPRNGNQQAPRPWNPLCFNSSRPLPGPSASARPPAGARPARARGLPAPQPPKATRAAQPHAYNEQPSAHAPAAAAASAAARLQQGAPALHPAPRAPRRPPAEPCPRAAALLPRSFEPHARHPRRCRPGPAIRPPPAGPEAAAPAAARPRRGGAPVQPQMLCVPRKVCCPLFP